MNRLIHSREGASRALQISSAQIFMYVEGGLDRVYADKILSAEFRHRNVNFQVLTAKEVASCGGKKPLIELFKDKKRRNSLAGHAFGKKYICLFLFDKDSDDFTRKKLRSDFILYTETYEIEGDLLWFGDEKKALSEAAFLTANQAAAILEDKFSFVSRHTLLWKEWIALCLVSSRIGVNVGSSFGANSKINGENGLLPANQLELGEFLLKISNESGISYQEVENKFKSAVRSVENTVKLGCPLSYFKGKWAIAMLERHLKNNPRIEGENRNMLGSRLLQSLVSQVVGKSDCPISGRHFSLIMQVIRNHAPEILI